MSTLFPIKVFELAAGSSEIFGIEWEDWLGSDSIATSIWSIDGVSSPAELSYDAATKQGSQTFAKFAALAGAGNKIYRAHNQITNTTGQESPIRSIDIAII